MSSSRYQSRVLQFVAQQSMRVRDRARQGVRQMRLALTWGTQMVLYPVYVLFQSARLVGQQLEQAAQRVFPILTAALDPDLPNPDPLNPDPSLSSPRSNSPPRLPPQSDRPIEHLLDFLTQLAVPLSEPSRTEDEDPGSPPSHVPLALPPGKTPTALSHGNSATFTPDQWGFLLPDPASAHSNDQVNTSQAHTSQAHTSQAHTSQTTNTQHPTHPASLPLPSIQGIATLLKEKQIVLVDDQNTTHNVLTTDQQAYVQQQIVLEVAGYWRDRRQHLMLTASTHHPLGQRFLPVLQERETMLPPVRYMRRFIGWMQRGPVAIATNLFQESALVPATSPDIQRLNGVMANGGMANGSPGHGSPGHGSPGHGSPGHGSPDYRARGYEAGKYGHGPSLSLHATQMGYGASSFPMQFMGQLLEPAPGRPSPLTAVPAPPPSIIPGATFPQPLYPLPPSVITSRIVGDRSAGNLPVGNLPILPSVPHPSMVLRPDSIPSPSTTSSSQSPLPYPPRPRQSLWNKLLNWIVTMTDDSKAGRFNTGRFNTGRFHSDGAKAVQNGQIEPQLIANLQPRPLPIPPELVQQLWFDPDHHGSEEGWLNANQLNQVRRQREFPPVVPSLPARVAPPTMQSPALGASYAHIEAYLNEVKSGGLITTQLPGTISEADVAQANPFPESAAAMLNLTDGRLPDPVAMEHYLAHHSAAYDFRRIEDPSVDRAFLYQVPTENRMQGARVETDNERQFSLGIPDYGRSDVTTTLLEATAEVVGYEKHPLERVLGWIDAGMAWVEGQIIYIWHWVRDRF